MGYHVHQNEFKFRIKRENFQKVLDAIKAMAGKETIHDASGGHFSWVGNFADAKTPHAALAEWRWNVGDIGLNDDITEIMFEGEKLGDDLLLFETIAPFVEAGSFIEMIGEDGARWKWAFDGKTCKEKMAKISYE